MKKLSYKQILFLQNIISGWGREVGNTNPTAIALEKRGLITTTPGRSLSIICTITDNGRKVLGA